MNIDTLSAKLATFIVGKRRTLAFVVAALTIVMALAAPRLELDKTLESGINKNAREFLRFVDFSKVFGQEEFILVAIKSPGSAGDRSFLSALEKTTSRIERLPEVIKVTSISNLGLFQMRNDEYGTFPFLVEKDGAKRLPDRDEFLRMRSLLPELDLLLSQDASAVGVVVDVSKRIKKSPDMTRRIVSEMEAILKAELPKESGFRIIGAPIIRLAIQKYNKQTALYFGLLSLLVAGATSVYIFKSLRATAITLFVIVLSIIWVTGLMALFGVTLNSTTSLAFGLIFIVSAAAVIHIVTHFNEQYRLAQNPEKAAVDALRIVSRPCLMCSLTTAAGFASISVSSIPMVRQLGLIMALGVLISYIIAIVITPTIIMLVKPPDARTYKRMSGDWISVSFEKMRTWVFSHYKTCAAIGLGLIALMLAGVPRIHSDTQLLRMLSESTKEMKDLQYVTNNLGSVHKLELLLEADEGVFKKTDTWRKIAGLEKRLNEMPDVTRTDSLLGLMRYLTFLTLGKSSKPDELFNRKGLVPQLLYIIASGKGGRDIRNKFVNEDFSKARISVRIDHAEDVPIAVAIARVERAAEEIMQGTTKVHVTGDLAVFEDQSKDLVRAQTLSLLIAISSITVLMIVQFRSLSLGLLSLIPNVFPLVVIFGLMGWLRISLDQVTVFAATVSIGLSVDDTIHYLTQLRREIEERRGDPNVEQCLAAAYLITAKALISTSAVLFFGFLMLLGSPFQPVIYFGLLGSTAVIAALIGDLVFLPSFILAFPPLKRIVSRSM